MIVAAENASGVDILDLLRTHIHRLEFSDESTEYQATTVQKLLFLPSGGQKLFCQCSLNFWTNRK